MRAIKRDAAIVLNRLGTTYFILINGFNVFELDGGFIMENLVTIASLFKQWETDVKPHVYEMFGECQDSYIASWMEYLDQPLAQDKITILQWAFAENFIEASHYADNWAEEFSRLLTLLGVELRSIVLLGIDPLGLATFEYVLCRHGVELKGAYSMPANREGLTRDDILESLFLEYSEYEECQNDFRYYCEKFQLDENEAESKKLYDQSEKLFQELTDLFAHNTTLSAYDIVSGFADIVWKL